MTAAIWLALLLSGLATYAERLSFLAVADRAERLPDGVRDALRMIPPAALAALVAPAVLRSGSAGAWALTDPRIPAALIAVVVMLRSRNVLATILAGMAVLLAGQALLG